MKLIVSNSKLKMNDSILFFSTNFETSTKIDSYFEYRKQNESMTTNLNNYLNLVYFTNKLIDFKKLCISSFYTKNILQIIHENEHFDFVKCFEIVPKIWYIRDLIKHLRNFIKHSSQCLTIQTRKHKFFNSFQFIDSLSIFFHIITLNFILILSKTLTQ